MSDGLRLLIGLVLVLGIALQLAQWLLRRRTQRAPEPIVRLPRPAAPKVVRHVERPAKREPPASPRPARDAPPRVEPRRARSLRRAIVLMEVLGPPRTVREETTPFL
jgi:hypothetical protein